MDASDAGVTREVVEKDLPDRISWYYCKQDGAYAPLGIGGVLPHNAPPYPYYTLAYRRLWLQLLRGSGFLANLEIELERSTEAARIWGRPCWLTKVSLVK